MFLEHLNPIRMVSSFDYHGGFVSLLMNLYYFFEMGTVGILYYGDLLSAP